MSTFKHTSLPVVYSTSSTPCLLLPQGFCTRRARHNGPFTSPLCPLLAYPEAPDGHNGTLWDGWALALWICMSSYRRPRLSDPNPCLIISLTGLLTM